MSKMLKFTHINQFRNTISDINHYYEGKEKPTLTFIGTTKLHGSNGGVSYDGEQLWVQSRKNVITVEKDNAGFAFFVESHKDWFEKTLKELYKEGYVVSIYGEWCGCFYYDTPITLADGTRRKIGQIVRNKEEVEVLSYNFETSSLEPKKVVGWHDNGVTEDWLTINVKRRKRGGKSTRLIVTPNHNIFVKTAKGIEEVNAKELKVGDIVFLHGMKLPYRIKQFLLGTSLGDGHLTNSNVIISHSNNNQKFYNDFIREFLAPVITKEHSAIGGVQHLSGEHSNMSAFNVASHVELKKAHDLLWQDGNKVLTEDYLNKLHPIALATWYMDDGWLIQHPEGNRQPRASLCTMGYTKDSVYLLANWFNKHGYECVATRVNKEKDQYEIRFTVNGSSAFFNNIASYVLEGFNYKLPERFRGIPKFDWNKDLDEYEENLVETYIESIEKGNPYTEKHKKTRFDLTIEDNHNYFANGILVHNSGIQKNVAIAELEKSLYLFAVKYTNKEEHEDHFYVKPTVSSPENNIYNVYDFKTWTIDIDFKNPAYAQNQIVDWVLEVEKECPVAKELGVSGIGEGLVFSHFNKKGERQYIFKAKGEKHSASRVKTIAKIDPEKMDSINDFVDYSVTENRLNQAVEQVFTINSEEPSIEKMGDFLRWIINDISREEMDTMVASNLEPKDVNKYLSTKARVWFMEYLDKLAMGDE